MGVFTQLFRRRRTETWQRTSAADPDTVFYVREWCCKVGSTREQVATVLGLHKPREAGWIDGIIEVDVDPAKAFVVENEGATFAFVQGDLGFTDFALRLSAPSGAAYTVFLDDKRSNVLCTYAVDGKLVRQLAYADGVFSEQGERGTNEPDVTDRLLPQSRVLDLATAWGPDPRALVEVAPTGWLYSRG